MSAIHIKPLTATIGAELSGIDLRKPLEDDEVDCGHGHPPWA